MKAYLSHIARLDAEDSSELINNSSTEHAIALIAMLFSRGKREVDVFTGSLSPTIYCDPQVIRALGVFLVGRGGRLRVVVQDELSQEGPDRLIAELRNEFGEDMLSRVTIRYAREEIRQLVTSHFLVVDEKGFRFEPNRGSHKAVASFNLPEIATNLRAMFDALFARAGEVVVA